MRLTILASAIAILGLAWHATPAWAAKGAKKNAAGERVVEGVIVSVQSPNNGQGSFVLHVHHHKKNAQAATGQAGKVGAAAQGAGQAGKGAGQAGKRAGKGHTFNVNQNTRFESSAAGKGAQQVSFANLKAGEHVTVTLKGKTAEVVKVHQHAKGQKKKA